MNINDFMLAGKTGSGGGGGSGLPTPTAADVGKSLTVQKTYKRGAVIVPEQTVTVIEGEVQNSANIIYSDASLFNIGSLLMFVVDGTEYIATVVEDEGLPCFIFPRLEDIEIALYKEDNWYINFVADESTYTVSLYLAEAEYAWVPDEYPGWDVVVLWDGYARPNHQLLKGNYDRVFASCVNSGSPTTIAGLYIERYTYGDNGAIFTGTCSISRLRNANYLVVYCNRMNTEYVEFQQFYWLPDGTITDIQPV